MKGLHAGASLTATVVATFLFARVTYYDNENRKL